MIQWHTDQDKRLTPEIRRKDLPYCYKKDTSLSGCCEIRCNIKKHCGFTHPHIIVVD